MEDVMNHGKHEESQTFENTANIHANKENLSRNEHTTIRWDIPSANDTELDWIDDCENDCDSYNGTENVESDKTSEEKNQQLIVHGIPITYQSADYFNHTTVTPPKFTLPEITLVEKGKAILFGDNIETTRIQSIQLVSDQYETIGCKEKEMEVRNSFISSNTFFETNLGGSHESSKKKYVYSMKRIHKDANEEVRSTSEIKLKHASMNGMMMEIQILLNIQQKVVSFHPNVIKIYCLHPTSPKEMDQYFYVTDGINEMLPKKIERWKQSYDKYSAMLLTSADTTEVNQGGDTQDLHDNKTCSQNKKKDCSGATQQIQKLLYRRLDLLCDIASALVFLHEHNLVYFLRPTKVGFDCLNQRTKLCHFFDACNEKYAKVWPNLLGSSPSSGCRNDSNSKNNTMVDILPYTAPEVICRQLNVVHKGLDVYAFGILVWHILTFIAPYSDVIQERSDFMTFVVMQHSRPDLNKIGSMQTIEQDMKNEITELLTQCWDPFKRLSMKSVLCRLQLIISTMHHTNSVPTKRVKQNMNSMCVEGTNLKEVSIHKGNAVSTKKSESKKSSGTESRRKLVRHNSDTSRACGGLTSNEKAKARKFLLSKDDTPKEYTLKRSNSTGSISVHDLIIPPKDFKTDTHRCIKIHNKKDQLHNNKSNGSGHNKCVRTKNTNERSSRSSSSIKSPLPTIKCRLKEGGKVPSDLFVETSIHGNQSLEKESKSQNYRLKKKSSAGDGAVKGESNSSLEINAISSERTKQKRIVNVLASKSPTGSSRPRDEIKSLNKSPFPKESPITEFDSGGTKKKSNSEHTRSKKTSSAETGNISLRSGSGHKVISIKMPSSPKKSKGSRKLLDITCSISPVELEDTTTGTSTTSDTKVTVTTDNSDEKGSKSTEEVVSEISGTRHRSNQEKHEQYKNSELRKNMGKAESNMDVSKSQHRRSRRPMDSPRKQRLNQSTNEEPSSTEFKNEDGSASTVPQKNQPENDSDAKMVEILVAPLSPLRSPRRRTTTSIPKIKTTSLMPGAPLMETLPLQKNNSDNSFANEGNESISNIADLIEEPKMNSQRGTSSDTIPSGPTPLHDSVFLRNLTSLLNSSIISPARKSKKLSTSEMVALASASIQANDKTVDDFGFPLPFVSNSMHSNSNGSQVKDHFENVSRRRRKTNVGELKANVHALLGNLSPKKLPPENEAMKQLEKNVGVALSHIPNLHSPRESVNVKYEETSGNIASLSQQHDNCGRLNNAENHGYVSVEPMRSSRRASTYF